MPQSGQVANILGMHPGFAGPLLTSIQCSTIVAAGTVGTFYVTEGAELAFYHTSCNMGPVTALGSLAGLLGVGAVFTGRKFDRDSARLIRAANLAFNTSIATSCIGVGAATLALVTTRNFEDDVCGANFFLSMPPMSLVPYATVGGIGLLGYLAASGIIAGARQVVNFVNNSRAATDDTISA